MNLCGVPESLETSNRSKVMPVSQTHPPPSPLLLSIAPPEFQTPRSKGESLGMTATPSPALLNPLTNAFWNDSSSARAPILCPRLESAPKISEPLIQRLLSGFRVVSFVWKACILSLYYIEFSQCTFSFDNRKFTMGFFQMLVELLKFAYRKIDPCCMLLTIQ
jgi:hypothetical protein